MLKKIRGYLCPPNQDHYCKLHSLLIYQKELALLFFNDYIGPPAYQLAVDRDVCVYLRGHCFTYFHYILMFVDDQRTFWCIFQHYLYYIVPLKLISNDATFVHMNGFAITESTSRRSNPSYSILHFHETWVPSKELWNFFFFYQIERYIFTLQLDY